MHKCMYTVVEIVVYTSAGVVSNGEHNTLRSMGYTRPVSVLRIKASVRAKYSKVGENRLLKMINLIGK